METKNARKEAAVLVLVVFLLGLLLGGVGNHLWDERVHGQEQVNTKPTRQQVLNDLNQRLQLTPDQQTKIAASIDATRSRWASLYAPLDAPREEIRKEGRANIRAVLTPDQQTKFDEFLKVLDEQRQKEAAAAAAAH